MTPYYSHGGITIYPGRCEDILPALEAVDVVITDPPYSEHVHSKNRRGASLPDAGEYKACISRARELGFDAITPELMRTCAAEFSRLVRRWVLVFSNVELCSDWREELAGAGLDYVRTGAWVKENSTPQFTGDRPGTGFEAITICHPTGRKRWNGGGLPAIWSEPIVINRGGLTPRLHTTQKPEPLMRQLVALFSEPGELVLDAFMGSGTTLAAAKALGRRAIGIELDERYCEIAARRLSQEVLPLEAA
jgi:DNA modification methylase